MTATTPVRDTGTRTDAGWVLLRDVGSSYRDGAEEALLDLVNGAQDLRSDSDELVSQAKGWAQRYHLDPDRSNVVRGLAFPEGARVLEIGAGCGAVTRYLGENAALVDALEPVPARASVARARTRDLPGVEVFVGQVEDLPAVPAYDVVVVVGVLEYVGGGTADSEPYAQFLRAIHDRLVDGGSLVLAIENPLGAKYFAGAPEDHTNRVFDSLEDYPYGGHARTFSRPALEALVRAAGLEPFTLGAFPDYKMTRTVLDPVRLGTRPDGLLANLPRFPSPDHLTQRAPLVDEGSLWRTACRAGLAADLVNSFVVLAGKGGRSTLWPEHRLALYHSEGRARAFLVDSEAWADEDGRWWVTRTPRLEASADATGPRVAGGTEAVVDGVDFIEWAARTDDASLGERLAAWVADVRDEEARTGSVSIDRVPHNIVVAPDGTSVVIDQEWVPYLDADAVVQRGLFWLAQRLAMRTSPARWQVETVGELTEHLARLARAGLPSTWVHEAVRREAELQAAIGRPAGGLTFDERVDVRVSESLAGLSHRLDSLPLGWRAPAMLQAAQHRIAEMDAAVDARAAEHAAQLQSARTEFEREVVAVRTRHEEAVAAFDRGLAEARDRAAQLQADLDVARAETGTAHAALEEIRGSRTWRATRGARAVVARVLPPGGPGRRAAGGAVGALRSVGRRLRRQGPRG